MKTTHVMDTVEFKVIDESVVSDGNRYFETGSDTLDARVANEGDSLRDVDLTLNMVHHSGQIGGDGYVRARPGTHGSSLTMNMFALVLES